MLCKIADLTVEIPEAGGMSPRCRDYLTSKTLSADITICAEQYRTDRSRELYRDKAEYMESGRIFTSNLLYFNGMVLHASAVALDGRAYLFSGPCGTGKSTHTGLWQQVFGEAAQVFNDDKPALRRLEDGWFAYGTPWSGKNEINVNRKVALAGICFLKQSEKNEIRRLSPIEALPLVISQTMHRFRSVEKLDLMLKITEQLVQEIPIYEFYNRPEREAAMLSFQTMRRGAEE